MPGKKDGRPPGTSPLLTETLTKAICDMLEIAVPEKYAAEANGVDEMTFHGWMRKGAAGVDQKYVIFREAVTRARSKCVANMHARALGGGKGSSASLWMLERRWWREYAQHQRVEIAAPEIPISDSDLDDEIAQQRKRVAAFERVRNLILSPGDGPKP